MPNPFHQSSPDFDRLFIIGAGGFGREVAWLARQCWGATVRIEFLVTSPDYISSPIHGIPVSMLDGVYPSPGDRYVTAIANASVRSALADTCSAKGLRATTIIHPRVESSEYVTLDAGTIICAGSALTTDIKIGRHVHINLDCTVGHDVGIGDFSTLSPGVHVSGHVMIGHGVFVGTGVTIINGSASDPLVIGNGAIVAAGSCVTKSVLPDSMVAGVPALRKR